MKKSWWRITCDAAAPAEEAHLSTSPSTRRAQMSCLSTNSTLSCGDSCMLRAAAGGRWCVCMRGGVGFALLEGGGLCGFVCASSPNLRARGGAPLSSLTTHPLQLAMTRPTAKEQTPKDARLSPRPRAAAWGPPTPLTGWGPSCPAAAATCHPARCAPPASRRTSPPASPPACRPWRWGASKGVRGRQQGTLLSHHNCLDPAACATPPVPAAGHCQCSNSATLTRARTCPQWKHERTQRCRCLHAGTSSLAHQGLPSG